MASYYISDTEDIFSGLSPVQVVIGDVTKNVLKYEHHAAEEDLPAIIRHSDDGNTIVGTDCLDDKNLLTPGQIIFGTITPTREKNSRGLLKKVVSNLPLFSQPKPTELCTYLQAGVYAGVHHGQHFVVDTGGHKDKQHGLITVQPITDLLAKDSILRRAFPPDH